MNETAYKIDGTTFYSSEFIDNLKKDKKSYIYDSLVLRYKEARYKQSLLDEQYLVKKYFERGCPIKEAEVKAQLTSQDRYERDFMRFINILNEAIGEHE